MVITCPFCDGDGTYPESQTCSGCGGDGEVDTTNPEVLAMSREAQLTIQYQVLDELETKLPGTNVFWSYQIWGATDQTEYQALSAGGKTNYNNIVHMGTVDLNTGTTSRAVLWNLFDSESTTRANLLALLT